VTRQKKNGQGYRRVERFRSVGSTVNRGGDALRHKQEQWRRDLDGCFADMRSLATVGRVGEKERTVESGCRASEPELSIGFSFWKDPTSPPRTVINLVHLAAVVEERLDDGFTSVSRVRPIDIQALPRVEDKTRSDKRLQVGIHRRAILAFQ